MKLTKPGILLLAGGVPLILFGSLGMARSQQVNAQTTLVGQLSLAGQRLAKLQLNDLILKKAELQQKINQTVAQTETLKSSISQTVSSIEASASLLSIAKEAGVEITDLGSSDPNKVKLGGVDCSALPITAKAEGDVPNLVIFIQNLNDRFKAGLVESAQITIPNQPDVSPSASIRLLLYTYQGAGYGK